MFDIQQLHVLTSLLDDKYRKTLFSSPGAPEDPWL